MIYRGNGWEYWLGLYQGGNFSQVIRIFSPILWICLELDVWKKFHSRILPNFNEKMVIHPVVQSVKNHPTKQIQDGFGCWSASTKKYIGIWWNLDISPTPPNLFAIASCTHKSYRVLCLSWPEAFFQLVPFWWLHPGNLTWISLVLRKRWFCSGSWWLMAEPTKIVMIIFPLMQNLGRT